MLQAIARALGLQAPAALAGSFSDRSSRDLLDRIVDRLKEDQTLLVLDSVETPWHADESATEAALAKIYEGAAVSNSAIVAVITGCRRPLKVPWSLRIDLTPLTDEDGARLFIEVATEVAKEIDKHVWTLSESDALRSLIKILDGIPLAIKVMAHAATIKVVEDGTREDWEPVLIDLRKEWVKKRSSFVKEQSPKLREPPFSLFLSLGVALEELDKEKEISMKCLGLMTLLPDGIFEADLTTLRAHVAALERSSLAAITRWGFVFVAKERIRLEPSIRKFAHETLAGNIDPQDRGAILNHYLAKATKGEAIGWGIAHECDRQAAIEAIKAETNNIEAIIHDELSGKVIHTPGTGFTQHKIVHERLSLAVFESLPKFLLCVVNRTNDQIERRTTIIFRGVAPKHKRP